MSCRLPRGLIHLCLPHLDANALSSLALSVLGSLATNPPKKHGGTEPLSSVTSLGDLLCLLEGKISGFFELGPGSPIATSPQRLDRP